MRRASLDSATKKDEPTRGRVGQWKKPPLQSPLGRRGKNGYSVPKLVHSDTRACTESTVNKTQGTVL